MTRSNQGLYDFVRWNPDIWRTEDLGGHLEEWKISDDNRLCKGRVREEKLPEDQWPTKPGEEWHGMVGTTRTVVVGWDPTNLTIDLRMTREKDGLQQICCFIHGTLAAVRAPGEGDVPLEERAELPLQLAPVGDVAGSDLLARIAAGD